MTATVKIHGVREGQTLTARLFPDGSSTPAESGLSVTYSGTEENTALFTTTASFGVHYVELLNASNRLCWYGWAKIVDGATAIAADSRADAVACGCSETTAPQTGSDSALGNELTDAKQALANWLTREKELSREHKPTYTLEGNTYNWKEWAELVSAKVAFYQKQVAALEGPIFFISGLE